MTCEAAARFAATLSVRNRARVLSYAASCTRSDVESITCPGCQKAIRVPSEVLGQRAQCPFCQCHFQAPVRADDGSLTAPRLIRRNPFARSRTFGPGMGLVFVGLLGMVSNGVQVGRAYSDPEKFAEQTREFFQQAKLPDPERTVKWMPVARVAFLALSILVAAGGVAMLTQRLHGLAMLASVGALFLVTDCCCVLGFPIGGWSLYVLRDPTVQAHFRRATAGAPPA